jgi:hypothetical protein
MFWLFFPIFFIMCFGDCVFMCVYATNSVSVFIQWSMCVLKVNFLLIALLICLCVAEFERVCYVVSGFFCGGKHECVC